MNKAELRARMMRQFHPASMPMSPVNHRIEDAEQGVSPVENGPTSRKRSTRACDVSLAFQVGPQLTAGLQGVSPALAGVSTLTSQEAPKMRGPQSRRGVGAGDVQALSGWAGGLHVHCAGTEEVRGRPIDDGGADVQRPSARQHSRSKEAQERRPVVVRVCFADEQAQSSLASGCFDAS